MRIARMVLGASLASAYLTACNKTPEAKKDAVNGSAPSTANVRVVGGWMPDSTRLVPAPERQTIPVAEEPVLAVDSVHDPLESITAVIDTTIKLGAWLKTHPSDSVSNVAPVGGVDDPFCRAALVRMYSSGRSLVRSALFYIPPPPKGELLPIDTAKVAENLCELRAIVLSSDPIDSAKARALVATLSLAIDRRLGPHHVGLKLGAGGIAMTEDGNTWTNSSTTVVVATQPQENPEPHGQSTDAETAAPSHSTAARAFVVAYAPGSGAEDFDTWESRYNDLAARRATDARSLYRSADSAMAWADLPSIASDLRIVLAYLRQRDDDKPDSVLPSQVDAALLRALKATHDQSPALTPPRRAAALLAADIVLFAAVPTLGSDSTKPMNRKLASLGITFDDLSLDNAVQNTRPWLWEAYRLDSLGRAGHEAFIELLATGWTTRGGCKEGDDNFSAIIRRGEEALRKGDSDPRVHYYVGSAYKTIYDLANYAGGEYFDPAKYKPQAELARLKAIDHFKAALESLADAPMRRLAWGKAMRILLRRSGEQPEYWCFYD